MIISLNSIYILGNKTNKNNGKYNMISNMYSIYVFVEYVDYYG